MLFLFFDVAPLMSYGEKTVFPCALPFILGFFPPRMCTWRAMIGWIPVEVTSSSHFAYLSAGRSRLATFIWDRTTEKVSISPFFSCLARHPRPVMGVLAMSSTCPSFFGQLISGAASFGWRRPGLFSTLECLAPC